MKLPDRWCLSCGFYYIASQKKHKCQPNFYHCRYMFTTYGTRNVKPIFFCIFCHRFNLTAQRVICINRNGQPLNPRIIDSFSCNQFFSCRLHKDCAAICLNNPSVNNLKIYTYFNHSRQFPSFEYAFCKSCKRYPEPYSLFCQEQFVTITIRQFVKQYLLKDGLQFSRSPNLANVVKKSEHSVSFRV